MEKKCPTAPIKENAENDIEHRIQKLESAFFTVFGFLFGMILAHIIIDIARKAIDILHNSKHDGTYYTWA